VSPIVSFWHAPWATTVAISFDSARAGAIEVDSTDATATARTTMQEFIADVSRLRIRDNAGPPLSPAKGNLE
jgi:hypothetical protein